MGSNQVSVEVLEKPSGRPLQSLITGSSECDKILARFDILKANDFFQTLRKGTSFPDEPPLFGYRTEVGAGVSFFSEEAALLATLGETLERGLWERPWRGDIQRIPSQRLNSFFDTELLAGFSLEQREKYATLVNNPNPEILCVYGYSHTKDKKSLIPLQLVNKYHFISSVVRNTSEPRLRTAITTGLATAQSKAKAQLNGFLEVIERDAFMVSYLNSLTLPRLNISSLSEDYPELAILQEHCGRYKLQLDFVQLITDASVHAYAAVITDPTGKGPAVSVGAKASFSLLDTLLGSAAEAMTVRFMYKYGFKESERTPLYQLGRLERLKWWSNQDQLPKIQDFIKGPYDIPETIAPIKSAQEGLERIRTYCEERSYQMLSVDYPYSFSQKMKLEVAYCLIPELQPLYLNEQYPAKSGERLTSIPAKFGYTGKENPTPHPFP